MKNQIEPKEMLTRRELCRRWNVGLETLKRREKEGLIRPLKLGKTIRFRREDVERVEALAAVDAVTVEFPGPGSLMPTSWHREAVRLGAEYMRSGLEADRMAFERHIAGMVARAREVVR